MSQKKSETALILLVCVLGAGVTLVGIAAAAGWLSPAPSAQVKRERKNPAIPQKSTHQLMLVSDEKTGKTAVKPVLINPLTNLTPGRQRFRITSDPADSTSKVKPIQILFTDEDLWQPDIVGPDGQILPKPASVDSTTRRR